jgi:hypothetical protein
MSSDRRLEAGCLFRTEFCTVDIGVVPLAQEECVFGRQIFEDDK